MCLVTGLTFYTRLQSDPPTPPRSRTTPASGLVARDALFPNLSSDPGLLPTPLGSCIVVSVVSHHWIQTPRRSHCYYLLQLQFLYSTLERSTVTYSNLSLAREINKPFGTMYTRFPLFGDRSVLGTWGPSVPARRAAYVGVESGPRWRQSGNETEPKQTTWQGNKR